MSISIEALRTALPKLGNGDRTFAQSLLDWADGGKTLSDKQSYWVVKLTQRASQPPKQSAQVGDLTGLLALFGKAKQHLKFPAIVLRVPLSTRQDFDIRITVAGQMAKHPGTINVTSQEKSFADDRRAWLGRVYLDGRYEPSNGADLGNTDPEWSAKVSAALTALALDPAKTAKAHAKATERLVNGRLTGNCCFCHQTLTDDRSTAVGYGATCAKNWGQPWGLKCEAVS